MEQQTKKYAVTFVVFLICGFGAFLVFQKFYPESQVSQSPQEDMLKQANQNEGVADESASNNVEGLKIEVLQEGTGEQVSKAGDLVTVHYTGTLEDGFKFDSSIDRGEPFTFPLGQGSVIQGWEKGISGMKVGEKRRLTISPELGYGEQGTPGGPIPPNATLIFEVEMISMRSN
ncbi:FKBP-type peptidyl-prolyl cis-trans isomerase [Candidatus Parcubacteria bacterium]|nr:FKBP-type peptidyl-prolyl cis-trans isomerase [Candidatus Parcubacteria bacterium]